MIGIVLWSDPDDCKAVFWCEDQGDLAYFEGNDTGVGPDLHAGDMVQFDVSAQASMRIAHTPRLLQEQVHVDLPETLRKTADDTGSDVPHSAQIIPFAQHERWDHEKSDRAAKA